METNIDDQTPESLAPVVTLLLKKGALDAFFSSIQMKKNRPAIKLSVLLNPKHINKVAYIILKNTNSLGVRYQRFSRIIMLRTFSFVKTQYGLIKIKIAHFKDIRKVSPEFEDCLKASNKYHVPLQKIFQEVYKNI